MNSVRKYLLPFIFVTFSSCSPNPAPSINTVVPTPSATLVETDISISIITIEEVLPILFTEARKWSPDAYLVQVDIPVQSMLESVTQPWLVNAHFQSLHFDQESLRIIIENDGSFSTKKFDHPLFVDQVEPITQGDWALDTDDLFLVLQDYGIHISQMDSETCYRFILRRMPQFKFQVIWRIFEEGCKSIAGANNIIYIDALTGLKLELP